MKMIKIVVAFLLLFCLSGCVSSTGGSLPQLPSEPASSDEGFTPTPAEQTNEESSSEEGEEEDNEGQQSEGIVLTPVMPTQEDLLRPDDEYTNPSGVEYSQYREETDVWVIKTCLTDFFEQIKTKDLESMKKVAARMGMTVADVTWDYLYNTDGVIKEIKAPTTYLLDMADNGEWTYFATIPVVRLYTVDGASAQESEETYAGYVTLNPDNLILSAKLESTETTQFNDYSDDSQQAEDGDIGDSEDDNLFTSPEEEEGQQVPSEEVQSDTTLTEKTVNQGEDLSENQDDSTPPSWLVWD